jgi:sigma-54-specific transcriptional regulator
LHLSPFEGNSSISYGKRDGTQPSLKLLENVLSDIYEQPIDDLFETLEEAIIRTAYAFCENNQVQTANLLGISRNILRHRLKRFGFLAA